MKVLFVSNDPHIFIEGSATRIRMQSYARAIGQLHILSRAPYTKTFQEGALTIHAVHVPRMFLLFLFPGIITRIVKKEDIQIVSAQDPFELGWVAMEGAQHTNAKLHVQLHTDVFSTWFTKGATKYAPFARMPILNRIRRRLAERVLPQAHGIRVVSKRIKDSLIAKYGTNIVEPDILPIGVAITIPSAVPLPENSFNFVFMCVGRLEPEKRIEDILVAFSLVLPQYPHAGLFIVGEGRERRNIERVISRLDLTRNVVLLGFRTDALGLMQSAQVFVQASAYEGYGLTLLEAALARVPIITSDVGIVGEILQGYEDVLSVPVGDTNTLHINMMRLIERNADRKELVVKAEATARAYLAMAHCTPQDIADDLEKTLSSHPKTV